MSNSRPRPVAWQEAGARHAVASGPRTTCVRLGGRPAGGHWSLPRSCVCALTVILALLLTELLSACGGASSGGSQQSAQTTSSGSSQALAPPVVQQASTGHYVGPVTIAGVTYFGDAVLTEDGTVRLYVGGADAEFQAFQVFQITRPESSEQFVGTIQLRDGQWSGSGMVIGQQCAVSAANPYCTQPSSATISAKVGTGFATDTPAIQGSIHVVTAGGAETWLLDLQQWPGTPDTSLVPGQYQEMLAEFASSGDVIMNVDSTGRFFFQSAASGCVGNGTSVARPDGTIGTFDITLLMENCTGPYAYLNGQYDGLALYTESSYWEYDANLRMWLSKPTGETPPAALTTFAGLL
jgi:hypothetical protein